MGELPPVLDRMLALWNGEDVDPRAVYAYGCVENGGEEVFDPEEIPPVIAALRTGAPDLRFEILDWFSAGQQFVLRLRAAGRHDGAFATPIGVAAPTGRAFTMRGIEVFEIRDDLITGVWMAWNFGELYAALGAGF